MRRIIRYLMNVGHCSSLMLGAQVNDPNMDTLKVTVDPENNLISVYNNGRGIPIEMHSREKIWIPELIFGHLLSSSNYDDDEKKLTGGRNGYGAKLANIYSVEFTVETADKVSGQKYSQTWTDNMTKMGKPKITKNSKKEEYTRVSFRPDLKRFGMDSIDDDTVALLKKRVVTRFTPCLHKISTSRVRWKAAEGAPEILKPATVLP